MFSFNLALVLVSFLAAVICGWRFVKLEKLSKAPNAGFREYDGLIMGYFFGTIVCISLCIAVLTTQF
jgi:hypothetical protein